MKRSVIYKITSPTGKVYVGKTVNFYSRVSSYRNLRNYEQKAVHASILKHGWDNHVIEILEEAPKERLNELEIHYIAELKTFVGDSPLGLNLTRGGDGSLGRKDSEEVKNKRAKKHLGSKRSKATKLLMSEQKKGKIPFASTLPRSEAQLHHSRYGNLGKKKSPQALKKELSTKLSKFLIKHGGILQLDLNGNLVQEWRMLPKHVAKLFNIDSSYLLVALKIPGKIAKGYCWKYKNDCK